MGDTSETNTKVLSRELFLGVVALKRLYRKIIICATRTLFSGTVTYIFIYVFIHLFIYLYYLGTVYNFYFFVMLFILRFFFNLVIFIYIDMYMCESDHTVGGELRVVLDGSSFWADWQHCILYSARHSSLPEKEHN